MYGGNAVPALICGNPPHGLGRQPITIIRTATFIYTKQVMFVASCVLFDFDMTLVDSSYAITRCLNLVAEHFGLAPLSRETVLAGIGLPMEEACRGYWGRYDEAWLEYYRAELRQEEYDHLRPYASTVPLLEKLRSLSVRTGIVTNRRYASRAAAAAGVEHLVDCLVGLENVARGKPHPDPLLYALEALGCPPERSLYVGDTAEDMTAAAAAGMTGVGVLSGGRSEELLRSAGARWVLSSISEFEGFYTSPGFAGGND